MSDTIFTASKPATITLPSSAAIPGVTTVVFGGRRLVNGFLRADHPIDRRCQAQTRRGTRCRQPSTAVVFTAGERDQHSVCRTHSHGRRGWW